MKNDIIDVILDDYKSHNSNSNYKILGLLDLAGEYVDITNMFTSYFEIKDLKIKFLAIATSEDGYDSLLDLGFPKSKITKDYVED
jgi:hypothetical protein